MARRNRRRNGTASNRPAARPDNGVRVEIDGLKVKEAVFDAWKEFPRIKGKARGYGIRLSFNKVPNDQNFGTHHWLFDGWDGARVLQWWPGTGHWHSPMNGAVGDTASEDAALARAAGILRKRDEAQKAERKAAGKATRERIRQQRERAKRVEEARRTGK